MSLKKYKSLRLKEYDYSLPGAYFVTICTKNRKCLFGEIANEEMILSEAGKIANQDIVGMPDHYENVGMDEFVVMPNHIHMVVYLYEEGSGRQANNPLATDRNDKVAAGKPCRLQDIIGSFKSGVTRKTRLIKGFEKFGWQRYYYDHIVRNEKGLENISDYIRINPARWHEDIENELYFAELKDSERKKKAEEIYNKLLN